MKSGSDAVRIEANLGRRVPVVDLGPRSGA